MHVEADGVRFTIFADHYRPTTPNERQARLLRAGPHRPRLDGAHRGGVRRFVYAGDLGGRLCPLFGTDSV